MSHQLWRDDPSQARGVLSQSSSLFPAVPVNNPTQHEKAEPIGGFPERQGLCGDRDQEQIAASLVLVDKLRLSELTAANSLDGQRPAVDPDPPRTESNHPQTVTQLPAFTELFV